MASADWVDVGICALWITGLSVVLAAISYAKWRSREQGESLRLVLGTCAYGVALCVGLELVGVGLFFSAQVMWERVLWAVIAVLGAVMGARQCWALRAWARRSR